MRTIETFGLGLVLSAVLLVVAGEPFMDWWLRGGLSTSLRLIHIMNPSLVPATVPTNLALLVFTCLCVGISMLLSSVCFSVLDIVLSGLQELCTGVWSLGAKALYRRRFPSSDLARLGGSGAGPHDGSAQ